MALSEILYNLDPANTSCKENECYDEYDLFADSLDDINVDSLREAFMESFDILISEETANKIIQEL